MLNTVAVIDMPPMVPITIIHMGLMVLPGTKAYGMGIMAGGITGDDKKTGMGRTTGRAMTWNAEGAAV